MKAWYYMVMGEPVGPLSSAELRRHALDGKLTPDSYVRQGTDGRWVSAETVRGLFDPVPKPPVTTQEAAAPAHEPPTLAPSPHQVGPVSFPNLLIYAASGLSLAVIGLIIWAASGPGGESSTTQATNSELAQRAADERSRRLKQEAEQRERNERAKREEVAEKGRLLVAVARAKAKAEDERLRGWYELDADVRRGRERLKMLAAQFDARVDLPRVVAPYTSRFQELLPKHLREVTQEFGNCDVKELRDLLKMHEDILKIYEPK